VLHQRVDRSLGRRIGETAAAAWAESDRQEDDTAAVYKNRQQLLNEEERRSYIYMRTVCRISRWSLRWSPTSSIRHGDEDVQPIANHGPYCLGELVRTVPARKDQTQRVSTSAAFTDLGDTASASSRRCCSGQELRTILGEASDWRGQFPRDAPVRARFSPKVWTFSKALLNRVHPAWVEGQMVLMSATAVVGGLISPTALRVRSPPDTML